MMQWLTYLIRTPLGRAALCLLALLGGASGRAGSCVGTACVVAGPRLLSVDSGRSVILNTLIEGLLGGGNLSATALDWNAVAQADVRLDTFLNLLQARVSAASVQDALNTQITAATLFEVAAQAAQADGSTTQPNGASDPATSPDPAADQPTELQLRSQVPSGTREQVMDWVNAPGDDRNQQVMRAQAALYVEEHTPGEEARKSLVALLRKTIAGS